MIDGFEDDDIARAIALSLQEANMPPTPAPTQTPPFQAEPTPTSTQPQDIQMGESGSHYEVDEDEALFQSQLQQAIEMSKAESQPPPDIKPKVEVKEERVPIKQEWPSIKKEGFTVKQEPVTVKQEKNLFYDESSAGPNSFNPQSVASTSASTSSAPSRYDSPLMFDRAQMERERLARQKRLRPDILHESTSTGSQSQDDRNDNEDEYPPNAKKKMRLTPVLTSNGSTSDKGKVKQEDDGMFWDGEIRPTANKWVPQDGKAFRLSGIFAPRDEIEFAIMSAYCVNFPWMYEFFRLGTPVIMVAQDPQGNESLKEVLPNWIKTTPFLRGGRGCMHMKFMLLFYKSGRLRVVVSTANLIEIDWRDIENTAWVQDFPKLPEPIPHDSKATDFASTWTRILRGVNVVPALLTLQKNGNANLPISRIEDIRCRWDFSKVKVELIPSLAGKHEGWPKVIQTGHTALMRAVRDIGGKPRKGKELVLECQGSSIGSYTTQWLNEFYCSAKGDSAEEWLDQPRGRRAKLPFPTIRILFPSLKTVRESALGEPGGGTMFCRRNQWDAAKFPRDHFFDSKSRRGSVLMHTKMILATYRDTGFIMNGKTRAITPVSGSESEDSDIVEIKKDQHKGEKLAGWVYVGSHNFTPSAWGTLSGSSFNPSLNITNYELGIVLPLKTEEDIDAIACWERPAKKYVLGKDQPWIQSESIYFTAETEWQ